MEFRGMRPRGTGSAEARREDGERRRGAMRRNSRQGAEAVLWVEVVGIMERVYRDVVLVVGWEWRWRKGRIRTIVSDL